jgi:NADH-quinone oxidoreductase subunit H
MILMCAMTTILFLGGWLPPFDSGALHLGAGRSGSFAKICFCLFVFLWVRRPCRATATTS